MWVLAGFWRLKRRWKVAIILTGVVIIGSMLPGNEEEEGAPGSAVTGPAATAAPTATIAPTPDRRGASIYQTIRDVYAGTSRAWVASAVTGVVVDGGTATVTTVWFPKDSNREDAGRLCNVVATGGASRWDLRRVLIHGQGETTLARCDAN